MEKNNFNKAYLYIISIFAIGLAISNIMSFFNGVGFALLGSLILAVLAITNILRDDKNKKRFTDILVLLAVEFILMFILFFAYDFAIYYIRSKFPFVMRNICAVFSLICIAYIVFRYICEIKGKKFTFIEVVLGNYERKPHDQRSRRSKKNKAEVRKNRELENGTFEPKPSSVGYDNTSIEENGELPETETSQEDVENDNFQDENEEDIIRF